MGFTNKSSIKDRSLIEGHIRLLYLSAEKMDRVNIDKCLSILGSISSTYRGSSALSLAIKDQNRQAVKNLIALGDSLGKYNDAGRSPLGFVDFMEKGTEPFIQFLIDHGADVNASITFSNYPGAGNQEHKITPLSWAVGFSVNPNNSNAGCDIIKLFVNNGANVNEVYPQGGTVLSEIANKIKHRSVVDIVKILLENGADTEFSFEGKTHIIEAKNSEANEMISMYRKRNQALTLAPEVSTAKKMQ